MFVNLTTILYFILIVVDISLIYQVFSVENRKKEHSHFAFLFFCIAVNFVHLIIYSVLMMLNINVDEYRSTLFFNLYFLSLFLYPQILLIALYFPFSSPIMHRVRGIGWLVHIPYICNFMLAFFYPLPEKLINYLSFKKMLLKNSIFFDFFESICVFLLKFINLIYDWHFYFFNYFNLIYWLLAVYIIVCKRNMLFSQQLKRQSEIILAVFVLIGGTKVILNLISIDRSISVIVMAWASLPAFMLLFIGFFRYKLLSVPILLRKGLFFSIFFSVIYLGYVFYYDRVKRMVVLTLGYEPSAPIIEMSMIFFSIILIPFLINRLDEGLDRFIGRKHTLLQKQLQILMREMMGKLDFHEIIRMLAPLLQENLNIIQVDLYLMRQDELELFPGSESDSSHKVKLNDRERLLLKNIAITNDFIELHELENRMDGYEIYEQMKARHIHYLVTLKHSFQILGFLGIGQRRGGHAFSVEDQVLLNMLSNQMSSILKNIFLYQETLGKERLQQELSIAREIQHSLLPSSFPKTIFCEIDAINITCLEVGGDYYDIWQMDDKRLVFAIGDVSGKGAPAALLMASLQSALRSLFMYSQDMEDVHFKLNNLIYDTIHGKQFITFFSGIFNPDTNQLEYINAGHNYPFMISPEGNVITLEEGGVILGVLPNARYRKGVIRINPGDLLFLYTDGITETFNENDEEFGEERLLKCILRYRHQQPQIIREKILLELADYSHQRHQDDDITSLILRIK